MAEKVNDPKLIAALIGTPTQGEAAKVAEVSYRTLNRRLKDPDFKRDLDFAQSEILSYTVRQITVLYTKAVMKFEELLEAESEHVQLKAARSIIQFGSVLMRDVEFEQRLVALEEEKQRRDLLSCEIDE